MFLHFTLPSWFLTFSCSAERALWFLHGFSYTYCLHKEARLLNWSSTIPSNRTAVMQGTVFIKTQIISFCITSDVVDMLQQGSFMCKTIRAKAECWASQTVEVCFANQIIQAFYPIWPNFDKWSICTPLVNYINLWDSFTTVHKTNFNKAKTEAMMCHNDDSFSEIIFSSSPSPHKSHDLHFSAAHIIWCTWH